MLTELLTCKIYSSYGVSEIRTTHKHARCNKCRNTSQSTLVWSL